MLLTDVLLIVSTELGLEQPVSENYYDNQQLIRAVELTNTFEVMSFDWFVRWNPDNNEVQKRQWENIIQCLCLIPLKTDVAPHPAACSDETAQRTAPAGHVSDGARGLGGCLPRETH